MSSVLPRPLPVAGHRFPAGAEDVPRVVLLDARLRDADEAGLRDWAREIAAAAGTPHVVRSYRFPFALVAWHHERVGVDLERIEPCDPRFLDAIRTPAERAHGIAGPGRDADACALWSGKEALAKALGDALSYDPRRLDGPTGWPGGRRGPWRAARVAVPAGHVGWLCWWAGEARVGRG